MSSSTLVDVAGAAERLGVSVRWIRRATHERRLPFVRVGRHIRFSTDDLDRFVEANRVPSVAGDRS